MKKKVMSIIAVVMCLILCACGSKNKEAEEKIQYMKNLQAKINIEEATIYLNDANKEIITSLYAMQEGETEKSIEHYQKALELVKDVKKRVDATISSPNFISKELGELEENFEETITILPRFLELSQEETDVAVSIMNEGAEKHIRLLKVLNASSFLYEIRDFDKLPDAEAQANLKERWEMFNFEKDVECPETVDKQELYLIWARQYFEDLDEEEFLTQLQILRENDDLGRADLNRLWTELIENFI